MVSHEHPHWTNQSRPIVAPRSSRRENETQASLCRSASLTSMRGCTLDHIQTLASMCLDLWIGCVRTKLTAQNVLTTIMRCLMPWWRLSNGFICMQLLSPLVIYSVCPSVCHWWFPIKYLRTLWRYTNAVIIIIIIIIIIGSRTCRLAPKSFTVNDPVRRNSRYLVLFHPRQYLSEPTTSSQLQPVCNENAAQRL